MQQQERKWWCWQCCTGAGRDRLVPAARIGEEDVSERDVADDVLQRLPGIGEGVDDHIAIRRLNHPHRRLARLGERRQRWLHLSEALCSDPARGISSLNCSRVFYFFRFTDATAQGSE